MNKIYSNRYTNKLRKRMSPRECGTQVIHSDQQSHLRKSNDKKTSGQKQAVYIYIDIYIYIYIYPPAPWGLPGMRSSCVQPLTLHTQSSTLNTQSSPNCCLTVSRTLNNASRSPNKNPRAIQHRPKSPEQTPRGPQKYPNITAYPGDSRFAPLHLFVAQDRPKALPNNPKDQPKRAQECHKRGPKRSEAGAAGSAKQVLCKAPV